MKLHEYHSKQLFAQFGVPIPKGKIATTPEEASQIALELGGRVVIKSQVLVGGRGKAGGIRLAKTIDDVKELSAKILGMEIKGLPVKKVLIDQAVDIETEIYLGITNDRAARTPVMMASMEGGIDIEEVAAHTPEKIIKVHIDPIMGIRDYNIRNLAAGIDLDRELWKQFSEVARGLCQAYFYSDATLAEINPLVITAQKELMAVDGKVLLDDNALFRQKELAAKRDIDIEDPSEVEARANGLTFIKLDGEIGCMVNGAGLAMATMDIIKHFGSEPANFLDIGGGASAERVAIAMRIILKDPNVKAVLLNIFGGITRGDEVAKGILIALQEIKPDVPMVVRLVGTNAEEGREILAKANMITAETLAEAARKAVQAAKGAEL